MIRILLILSLFAGTCLADDGKRMEQIVDDAVADKTFMGSVLVTRGDDVLLNKGFGSANLEWGVPNTPETKYKIGSITKQFTAAAILLLQERGKLKVTDRIADHLAEAPAAWKNITLQHLLTHTSGIPNFTALPSYHSIEPFPQPPLELVKLFRDLPLEFTPGEKWSYSNSGYIVLGLVIERVSGESYAAFIRENLLAPLGMKDSGYDDNSEIIQRRASGYSPRESGLVNARPVDMSVPFAAGGLYSTTGDLLRWEKGLFGNKVLSGESVRRMTTAITSDYGFGLGVSVFAGHKVIQHNGGINGFSSMLAYYPDDKLTIVILGNMENATPGAIAEKLATVAHGGTVPLKSERREVPLPNDRLAALVGTYQFEFAPGVQMKVFLDGGRLMSKLGPQNAIEIFAETENRFFTKDVDASIEFGKDVSGKISYLTLHQDGQSQNALRVSDHVELPPERKEASVARTLLEQYRGTYRLTPGFDIVVSLDGDRLVCQATGQPVVPLFAESEGKFFAKVVDAQIEFVRGMDGKVTQLVLHQGGRDQIGVLVR